MLGFGVNLLLHSAPRLQRARREQLPRPSDRNERQQKDGHSKTVLHLKG
jgi:hypothetical protein